jgi:hypothetical protein
VVITILNAVPISAFLVVSALDKSSESSTEIPGPELDQSTEEVFKAMGASIGNVPLTSEVGLPPALVTTSQGNNSDKIGKQIVFTTPAKFSETASELYAKYAIPRYQIPASVFNESVVFNPPTFVIRQIGDNDSELKKGGFFTLTPVLDHVIPPAAISIDKIVNPENASTEVKEISFSLSEEGESIGFSFGVSTEIPQGLNVRPTSKFKTNLFLNIDYIGKEGKGPNSDGTNTLNFSDPAKFVSSPEVMIKAIKSLDTVKLDDGCPKLAAGVFNEQTGRWQPAKINRTQLADTPSPECIYKLQTEHFSKFAVGGVVPPAEVQPS